MVLKICLKSNCLKKICNIITEFFNNEILFYEYDNINNSQICDYYIDYDNLHLDDKKCLNIICDQCQCNYETNILNLHTYFYILECNLNNISESYDKLIYISYVVYNFILINTKMLANKPIVLDPITTIFFIFNKNISTTRLGDGEVMMLNGDNILDVNKQWINNEPHSLFLFNEMLYINWLKNIIKQNNEKLLVCVQNCEYSILTNIYNNLFWFSWYNKGKKHYVDNKIYGDCLIGRPYAYKFNIDKYYEILLGFIKNKKIIVICNNKMFISYINKFYFVAKNISFMFVPDMFDTVTKNDSLNYVEKISKLILEKINENIQLCVIQFGLYSKFICDNISKFTQIIDIGEFVYEKPSYDKNFYYDIENVLSKLNYYIFDNGKINYDIVTTDECNFSDEFDPLIIIIRKILSENDKLDFNMEIFGVRFNQRTLSENYSDHIIKGKLKVTTNVPMKIFNGKKWLHLNVTNYEDDFEIHNINKWRVSPSTIFLKENLGMENVEFIIYEIQFKITEIV